MSEGLCAWGQGVQGRCAGRLEEEGWGGDGRSGSARGIGLGQTELINQTIQLPPYPHTLDQSELEREEDEHGAGRGRHGRGGSGPSSALHLLMNVNVKCRSPVRNRRERRLQSTLASDYRRRTTTQTHGLIALCCAGTLRRGDEIDRIRGSDGTAAAHLQLPKHRRQTQLPFETHQCATVSFGGGGC